MLYFHKWAATEAVLTNSSVAALWVCTEYFTLQQFESNSKSNKEKILLISVGAGALFSCQLHQSYTSVILSVHSDQLLSHE